VIAAFPLCAHEGVPRSARTKALQKAPKSAKKSEKKPKNQKKRQKTLKNARVR
jgi:hypothetical protein